MKLESLIELAVIVVWFNPSEIQVDNVRNLSQICKRVLIIDNSSVCSLNSAPECQDLKYYWMKRNLGISLALNHGCEMALSQGFSFALTLDQDSFFENTMLIKHIHDASLMFLESRNAVVATASQTSLEGKRTGYIQVKSAITSGSIIRLSAWRDVGRFDERLFIDQVDHDLCTRMRLQGYHILVNTSIEMVHKVGDPIEKTILGFRISSTNHHWHRRYYQVRNSLYLRKWYPSESKPFHLFAREIVDMIIGILFLEKDRLRKLGAMLVGVFDFYRNRTGSWNDARANV
jgi:rhamnosyltransferase